MRALEAFLKEIECELFNITNNKAKYLVTQRRKPEILPEVISRKPGSVVRLWHVLFTTRHSSVKWVQNETQD